MKVRFTRYKQTLHVGLHGVQLAGGAFELAVTDEMMCTSWWMGCHGMISRTQVQPTI